MIHYHGTPITPRATLFTLAGRHFCVSFATPQDVKVCHEIGQSVMLDNGAFTFWRDKNRGEPDWDAYMDWCEPWLEHANTWAVMPDVIDGDEEANDRALIGWFQRRMPKGVPVWHLHESCERLKRLAHGYGRVCFGSSGSYATVGTRQWHRRVSAAFDTIADPSGRVPPVHMLRGMALAGSQYPFASADSTNVAQNHHRPENTAESLARYLDSRQCPARWTRVGAQERIAI